VTYFGTIDVEMARVRISEMSFTTRMKGVSSRYAVLISVDAMFFRAYMPSLLTFFSHLSSQDVEFHIVLACEEELVSQALSMLETFQSAIFRFTGLRANVTLHHATVPAWVGERKTFYACSRFLHVGKILQGYDGVYVMDADCLLVENPAVFCEQLLDTLCDVAKPRQFRLEMLFPWRRYIANNVFLRNTVETKQWLEHLSEYLVYGLSQNVSWMLDQNGIDYANCNTPGLCISDLNSISVKRPAVRPSWSPIFEKNVMLNFMLKNGEDNVA
jgi:hypothetical protein